MDKKTIQEAKQAILKLAIALDASEDELIDCMTGTILSEEEAGQIKAAIQYLNIMD